MSRPLQADEAIDLLIKDPSKYQSPQALRELAQQVSVESRGQVTVLYSGRVADRVSAWNIVKAMEEAGEDVRLIDRTEINSFLNSREFTRAAAVAHGVTVDDMRRGDPIAKVANDWLYHPTEGPWADASARFADATRGEVKVIASGAAPDRVFGQTELPRILANPDVTTVEGIPRQTLAARQATHGTQAAFEMIVARSHENVGVIRSAVNAQGIPLRGDSGQLQLDNREYFRGTEIEARTPAFPESTRPMADLMGPPNAHALAGRQHLDELAQVASHAQRPGSSGLNPRLQGLNLGLAAEAAVTAYEWNETRQRAQVFANTVHNDTAARDAYVRQGAQTGGALMGTALGTGTSIAVGAGTGGTAVLVTGSAYLFATAAEHGMELWQKQQVYNIHSEGVDWKFNGKQWIREDLRADLVDDGQDVTRRQDFAAPPDKARELSAIASAKAVEQALGQVPTPRDPFVQSAGDGADPWRYQPETGQWTRQVVTAYDVNDRPSAYETVMAKDDQRAQLSAQAQRIIDDNLRAGPAEVAAQYQMGHKAYGYAQTPAGAMPDAISPALDPDLLQASDKKHYRRDAQGEWMHDGQAASPTRALELELTRDRLLPALEAHRQQLARMPDWQPPTPEEQDRAALREAYLNRGINREAIPENFEASYLGIQRTRADAGVSAANTSLVLGEDANGQFTPDSPIHHVRFAEDGTLRIAATTTREDIAQALADVRTHGRNEDTPQQAAPERVIAQATPEERDAREQAQREANRQGLSQDSVLQVVAAPSLSMGSGKRDAESREEEMPRDRSHEQRADSGPASPDATPPTPPRPPRSADPRDPDHPGHGLYKQIETGVAKLDASIGRTFDATSERLAMSTFHDARAAGMTSVNHVVLNNTGARQPDGTQIQANTLLIAIQGEDPYDPAARRSVTDVKQAAGQSLEHSLQKVVTLEQQQAQTQQPNPTQDDPSQKEPGPKGPRL